MTFSEINDPRVDRTKVHRLEDILGIVLCATMAGATGWDEMRDFAMERIEWFKRFLTLEAGVPSADTIRHVISKLNPEEFQLGFINWVSDVLPTVEGIVAIDGKTVKNKRVPNPIHLVSAWSEMNGGICLGQVCTDEKSNEITAIPNLLDVLDIAGCIVTIDAMGCQKKITAKIVNEKEADICIAVKGNQPMLHNELKEYFEECDGSAVDGATRFKTEEKNRGRLETRVAYSCHDISAITSLDEWSSVKSFGLIIKETANKNGQRSTERRYYISSAKLSAPKMELVVRGHWGIENKLHYVLDVTFKEDGSRVENCGQKNLATIRKIAMTLLKTEPTNLSMKRKMFKSAINSTYMDKVLKIG